MTTVQTPTPTTPPPSLNLPATPGARLCGKGRTTHGLYVECGQFNHGLMDIEHALLDPPQPYDFAGFGLSKIGVNVLPDGNIVDWVGEEHYPYPADFIEEARVMGISRKISPQTDLSLVTSRSLLILVHAKAVASQPGHLHHGSCPSTQHSHGQACAMQHWNIPGADDSSTQRHTTQGSYTVYPQASSPQYQPGVFMVIPITNLTVITDPQGHTKLSASKAVLTSGITPSYSRE